MTNAAPRIMWFGCQKCALAWHGATLPLDAKQYAAMFKRNQFCTICNAPTGLYGLKVPISTTPITLFAGTISELSLAMRKDAA